MVVNFLVLRLIETAFAQATPSRPNIAAGMSHSTNFCLTQGQSTLKFPLMGMVYTRVLRRVGMLLLGYSKHVGKMMDTYKQKPKKASEMPIKRSLFVGTYRSDSKFPLLVV